MTVICNSVYETDKCHEVSNCAYKVLNIECKMQETYVITFLVGITLSLIASSEGKIWALLVAGSEGYYNYRHQADVCHAYQILRHNGIPKENIITMMYDDIAYNEQNPNQGVIINQPRGKNVYKGVVKDYTKDAVTLENFLNVLSGNKKAMKNIGSGRVIESGPNDIVFVNYVDHGGPGVLGFPKDILTVKDLNDILVKLSKRNRYHKLIVYVEACHSGSMFENILADDTNIFAMTAADPNENSYAANYDSNLGIYVGDAFSVNWMQESERENLKMHSLNHLFQIVRARTRNSPYSSHVEEYGDLDVGNTLISNILGSPKLNGGGGSFDKYIENPRKDVVKARDATIQSLLNKLHSLERKNSSIEAALVRAEIANIYKRRHTMESVMDELVLQIASKNLRYATMLRDKNYSINKNNLNCYDRVVKEFSKTCINIAENPFVLSQLHVLVNACTIFNNNGSKIVRDIYQTCHGLKKMTNVV